MGLADIFVVNTSYVTVGLFPLPGPASFTPSAGADPRRTRRETCCETVCGAGLSVHLPALRPFAAENKIWPIRVQKSPLKSAADISLEAEEARGSGVTSSRCGRALQAR